MPITFSDITPVRRVAVGDCAGPLGSGFDALARTAYTALLRAEWTQSTEPPFLPVHDNGQTANKTIPRGDAWKCSYGYDATARTERSACGAVCYSFAIPSDAYSGTPANISTVSLSLTGDRYLDAGVDLYLVPSASATPPSIPDLLALTPVGTYCATSDQSPTKPNERHGVTEAVEATPGVAAQPYLHIALLLHDYTTNRGAWIEGGAMLEGATAMITFSREVAADSPVINLLLGKSATQGAIKTLRATSVIGPRQTAEYYQFNRNEGGAIVHLSEFDDPQSESMAHLYTPSTGTNLEMPIPEGQTWTSRTNVVVGGSGFDIALGSRLTSSGGTISIGYSLGVAARSGFVPAGKYSAMSIFGAVSETHLPIVICAYMLASPVWSAMPGIASISSPRFWSAEATSIDIIGETGYGGEFTLWSNGEYTPPPSSDTPAIPLFSARVDEGGNLNATYRLRSPLLLDADEYPRTVVVAFRADPGASSDDALDEMPPDFEVALLST